ncbi:MCE family protein [Nocardioides sp. GY 10113]|uniref:MlaD family protein n=1 Tax=Nocardioides sp. GY 10113 TaxID=2569761 RepID=UPI0010A890D6|nr:MlaD family protein [Nocardioides sp. GY 10113]TIC87924.1 MCE family protein [Nocardioides sp. GY 10113]
MTAEPPAADGVRPAATTTTQPTALALALAGTDRPVGSAQLWKRRARLAQALILAVMVGGVVYVADTVVGGTLFHHPYHVTIALPEAGGLHVGSTVTYRGQRIGEVTAVALTGRGTGATVEAELAIDPGVEVPADSDFEVHNLSAVGEQYLDVRPRTAGGDLLADGDSVPLEDTSTPLTVAQVLAHAQVLLRDVDPGDIRTIVEETNAVFRGGAVDLRSLSIQVEAAFALLQDLEPTLTRIVENGEVPLRTAVALGPDIRAVARDLALVAHTFRNASPTIRSAVLEATDLLPRLQELWRTSSPRVRSLLRNGVPITTLSTTHLRGLNHWLDWVPMQADAMAGATRAGSGRVVLVPRVLKNCVYSPRHQRDIHDTSRRAPQTDVHCTDPPEGTQVRGSGNVPVAGR